MVNKQVLLYLIITTIKIVKKCGLGPDFGPGDGDGEQGGVGQQGGVGEHDGEGLMVNKQVLEVLL